MVNTAIWRFDTRLTVAAEAVRQELEAAKREYLSTNYPKDEAFSRHVLRQIDAAVDAAVALADATRGEPSALVRVSMSGHFLPGADHKIEGRIMVVVDQIEE